VSGLMGELHGVGERPPERVGGPGEGGREPRRMEGGSGPHARPGGAL
jgi:hypothetical protein